MFQVSVVKVCVLLLLAASMGVFWYLDTKYDRWDQILSEPDSLVVENVPEPIVNDSFKPKAFIPTKEWQIIEKDQPIPPGLHVKINLQTGEKKAKLMEDNEINNSNSLAITHSNISKNDKQSNNLPEKVHKFKSYDEIKNDLGTLNMIVKSDIEIMDELSTKFQNQVKIYEDTHQSLQNILIDLEYLLHQVDTAESFVKNNGIKTIIIPCISSSSSFIKSQGALLLGSAASNNQRVQISAIKADVIPLLLNHISDEYDFKVQKNCIYALSTIIRHFPTAQKQVIDKDGINILMSVLKRPETDSNAKLKLKVSNLLQDLIVEIEDAKLTLIEEANGRRSSEARERVRQYEELHLKDKLVESGWCEIIADEFITLSNLLPAKEETNDTIVASGKSLLAIRNLCKDKLKGNKLLYDSLYKLETHYKKLAKQDNNLNPIYQLLNELTNTYDPVLV